jgi:8-oxo-dGTP diphosphatase
VVGAAIVEGARVLLTRRSAAMSMPGKWEFPGGKLEAGEAPEQALAREVREELGLEIEVGAFLGRGSALVGGRRIRLDVFLARRRAGDLALAEHDAAEWFAAGQLAGLDWPEADAPILPRLAAALARSG